MGEDLEEGGKGVLGIMSGNPTGRTYKKTTKILSQDSMYVDVGVGAWEEGREGARGDVAAGGRVQGATK